MNFTIYNVVGIKHFAKLAEASEGSETHNFKGSLIPAQIKIGKKENNKGTSNHMLSKNSPTP